MVELINWISNNLLDIALGILTLLVVYAAIRTIARTGLAFVPIIQVAAGAVLIVWLFFFGGVNAIADRTQDETEGNLEHTAPIDFGPDGS